MRLNSMIIVLVLCTATWPSCGGTAEQNETNSSVMNLQFHVEGAPEGEATLGGVFSDQVYFVQNAVVDANGDFAFTKDEPQAQGLYFVNLPNESGTIQFLIGPDQDFKMSTAASDLIGSMEVDGSLENELYYQNAKYEQDYQSRYRPLQQAYQAAPADSDERADLEKQMYEMIDERLDRIMEFKEKYPDALFTKFKLAGQNPRLEEPKLPNGEIDKAKQTYLYRNAYWDNVDFSDERLLRTPVFHNKLTTFLDELVGQNADSIIKYADMITRRSMAHDSVFAYFANQIGIKYKEPSFMGADAVYVHMIQNFFTPELATWAPKHELDRLRLDAQIRDASMIGNKAHNIEVIGMDGKKVSLYDTKAKFIVLYIYTPGCENCRKETPKIQEVYREWKSRGMEVFALCTDKDEDTWKNYVQNGNLDWINGFDPDVESNYRFKYHIDITPEVYVMDQDFKIIGKDLKAFQLATIFERNM